MIEFLSQPWPWWICGPLIALVLFFLLFFGKRFGMSSNLMTVCAAAGGGRFADLFRFDWKAQRWNLVVVLGAVIGGYIAGHFLVNPEPIDLNPNTIEKLETIGFSKAGDEFLPDRIFGTEALLSMRGIFILLLGGFLVGFGTRYAGGCTSGHAISGLSNLQLPSLIAVIGFFIGGLIMTHFLIPLIF